MRLKSDEPVKKKPVLNITLGVIEPSNECCRLLELFDNRNVAPEFFRTVVLKNTAAERI